jgi:hypothetical protein
MLALARTQEQALRCQRDLYDLVARLHFPFLQNAEIETRPALRNQ